MDDGVAFPDMAQEFIAQARTAGCAAHQTCDVHKFDHRVGFFIRFPDAAQFIKPFVGHRNDAGVRLNGAERVVGCLGVFGIGDGVEQGGLSHVGQSYDS